MSIPTKDLLQEALSLAETRLEECSIDYFYEERVSKNQAKMQHHQHRGNVERANIQALHFALALAEAGDE